MVSSHKGNIKLCASDSYMLRSLNFYFDDLLSSLREEFDLTGMKLSVHACSCHMLSELININIDTDDSDGVALITTRPCYRILKGLFNYKGKLTFIDIDNANSVIVRNLDSFIRKTIIIDEKVRHNFNWADDILREDIVRSYFDGVSPGVIAAKNRISQGEVSKVKRRLMSQFSVKTTQELYIKHQLYSKSNGTYSFEW